MEYVTTKCLDLNSLPKLTMTLVQILLRSYKVGYPTEFANMQKYIFLPYNQGCSLVVGEVGTNLGNQGSNLSRDKKYKVIISINLKSWFA